MKIEICAGSFPTKGIQLYKLYKISDASNMLYCYCIVIIIVNKKTIAALMMMIMMVCERVVGLRVSSS